MVRNKSKKHTAVEIECVREIDGMCEEIDGKEEKKKEQKSVGEVQ